MVFSGQSTINNQQSTISMDNVQPTATLTNLDDLIIKCKFVSSTEYSSKIVVGCQGFVFRYGSFEDVPLSRWEGFISGKFTSIKEYDDYDYDGMSDGGGPNYCMRRVGKYIKIDMDGGSYRKCITHCNVTQVILRASEFIPLLHEQVTKLSQKEGFKFADDYKYTDEIDSEESEEVMLHEWYKMQLGDEEVIYRAF